MPEITFLISSSGVAGRAMKIRSYSRSSMVASFLRCRTRGPGNSFVLRPPKYPQVGRLDHLNPALSDRGYTLPAPLIRCTVDGSKDPPLLFRLKRLAAVVLGHGRVESLCQNQFHRVACVADHFAGDLQLCFAHRPEYVLLAIADRVVGATAQPKARELLRAQRTDHRLRAVVTAGAAVRVNPNRTQRQLHFIPHHEQVAYIQFVLG